VQDISSLKVLLDSPGCLLKELGVGENIFLLRFLDVHERSGFIPLRTLDENIHMNGRAHLLCQVEAIWTMLRFDNAYGPSRKCVALGYSHRYQSFLFELCQTGKEDSICMTAREVWQQGYKLTLVPIGIFPTANP